MTEVTEMTDQGIKQEGWSMGARRRGTSVRRPTTTTITHTKPIKSIKSIKSIPAVLAMTMLMVSTIAIVGGPTPVSAGNGHFDFTPSSVLAATRLARDFYPTIYPDSGDTNWVYSTFYVGEFEYYKATGDPTAWDRTLKWAQDNAYSPYTTGTEPCATRNPDHQSGGQVLFEVAAMVGAPAGSLDCFRESVLGTVNSPSKRHWSWVDTLFMAPPGWAAMARYAASPDEQAAIYEAIYAEFANTRDILFNTDYNLFARDGKYIFPKNPSPDGSPQFWSRGNGWAFAGLARLIEQLPPDAPHYADYVDTYLKMAAALPPLQQDSGFWGADLLEPYHINRPESSGTAFFVYGMAKGVRMGLLDATTYMPTIERGWMALANTSLQDSGRLGWTQSYASHPYMSFARRDATKPYSVGAFVAASAEIYGLLSGPNVALGKPVTCSREPQPDLAPCWQAVDGDVNRRWSSNAMPSSIEIDLGAVTDLSAFRANFYYHRDYRYTVDVKLDAGDEYRTVIDRSGNTEGRPELLAFPDQTDARFVRVQVTGAASYRGRWVSIGELEVFGQPSPVQRVATPNPPTCSAEPQPHFPCAAALDGGLRGNERWSAMTFPQSIEVDLGGAQLISAMALHALHDRSYDYRLEVKTDPADDYHVAAEFAAGDGTGTVRSMPPIVARFARLTVTGIADRSTNWVSIREWELFGEPVAPTRLQPVGFTCSNEPQPQYSCANLFDGSTASAARWSTNGLGVVEIDLGETQTIRSYALATLAERHYGYKLEALVPIDPDVPPERQPPEVYVLVDERDGATARPGVQLNLARPVNTTKVRLTITSFPPGIIPWSSLTELSLYG